MNPPKRNVGVLTAESLPPLLREIPDPPAALSFLGSLPDPSLPHVAIVGTRKASNPALRFAEDCAARLAECGAVIVSGLALGLDGAAHAGALRGKGRTIAVLANGLPAIYPRHHAGLAARILDSGGAIVSEQPMGAPALPRHFLSRNRIISGLCSATIIIEAPHYSGSLATARYAAEQGREVLVVPGPIAHPHYQGSHALIRDGARLVSSIEDILDDLGFLPSSAALPPLHTPLEHQLVDILRTAQTPLTIDKLIEATTLEPHIVSKALTFLAIKNIIKETGGGYTL